MVPLFVYSKESWWIKLALKKNPTEEDRQRERDYQKQWRDNNKGKVRAIKKRYRKNLQERKAGVVKK